MLVIIFGRITQFLLMLITLKVSTYLLLPAEIGKMALIMSSIAFLSLFLVNPVGMYVNRRLHHWNNSGVVRLYLGYHWFYIFIIASLSTLSLALINYLGLIDSHFSTPFVIFFIFCTLFFNTINQTTIPSLNMLGFRESFTLLSIATIFSGILLALTLTACFDSTAEFWLLGLLGGQILFAIIGTKIFYSRINYSEVNMRIKPSFDALKTIFHFSWPLAFAVGLNWFQSQSYRFFIEHLFGLHALGLFVAGYGISAGIFAAFEGVFTTYFLPLFYKELSIEESNNEIEAWNDYAIAIIPSLVLLFFVITALAPELTGFMLAKGYADSAKFVVWGALIETFRVIVNVYSMAAHAKKDTKLLIVPNLIGAIFSVTLIYILTPYFGIAGIGLALVTAGFSATCFLHLSIHRKLPILVPVLYTAKALGFGLIIWACNYYLSLLFSNNHLIILSIVKLFLTGILALIFEFSLLKETLLFKENGAKNSGVNILLTSND